MTESSKHDSLLMAVLDDVGKRQESITRERLEREQQEVKKKEQRALDLYQWNQLVDKLEEVISKFNQESPIAEIRLSRGLGRAVIDLPVNLGRMELDSFVVEPPVVLRKHGWSIRFAGYLKVSNHTALNFLLCRENDEDLYGKWQVCAVSMSGFTPSRRPSPFGFENNRQIQQELRLSDEAMHVYSLHYSEDIEVEFLSLLHQAIQG